jgi:hypothetical protein
VFCDVEKQKGIGYRSASYNDGEAGVTQTNKENFVKSNEGIERWNTPTPHTL